MLKSGTLETHFLNHAGRWFLHSGIQSPDGGVARYYRGDEQRNLPVSTEITGYAASTYAWLYQRTGDEAYRDAAVRTAQFLARSAWHDELETFPFETAPGSPAYFFDCGIIVRGLLAVNDAVPVPELKTVAVRCTVRMEHDFLEASTLHPIIDLPAKTPRPHEKRWSREPGCFQLKAALPWYRLRLKAAWSTALVAAIDNHEAFLPGETIEEKVMDRLHAYCYFLEGLLAAHDDPAASHALRRGIGRTSGYLRAIRDRFLRSDVCAQLLRVRLFADRYGIEPLDRGAAEEEAALTRGFLLSSGDRRLDGAFSFGSRAGEILPIANPVSTAFCAQALDLWRQYEDGTLDPDLDSLI
jgi:hypothetical protein